MRLRQLVDLFSEQLEQKQALEELRRKVDDSIVGALEAQKKELESQKAAMGKATHCCQEPSGAVR